MDPFQFSLLIALGLFIVWRGVVIWKRGARGFAVAMFILATFVFYEASRIYYTPPTEIPSEPANVTTPENKEDSEPTAEVDEPKRNNNDQYLVAPTPESNEPSQDQAK